MGKGTGSKGSGGAKKWVPKGAEKEEVEEEEEEAPKPKTPKAKTPKNSKKKEVTSPILLEPSTGPTYDKMSLLRLFSSCKESDVVGGLTTSPKPAEVSTEEVPGDLALGLEARPEDEDTKTPGSRRAMREQLKEKKIAKRLSTGSLEEAADDTVSPSGGKTLDLNQELPEAPQTPMTPANAALMMYLQNMAAYAPYMAMGGYPGAYTTVMLRNIPNRYTRQMLCDRLNKGYKGQYDFVYLPIDFNSKCNVGYAFINFRTAPSAQRFIQEFHGTKTKHCLPGFSSEKVAEVSYGRVQGRDQNMENLRDEKFIDKLVERPEWQPLFLDDNGKEIPFSKTFGAGNKKRGKSSATPTHMIPPTTPTGFFSPYGQMPYPMYGMPPPAPPTTLASVLPTASVTTILMLRGVPAAYTRTKLLEFLNSKYAGTFDFLFIPGEAKSEEGNRGFAFINFKSEEAAATFTKDFSEKKPSECFPDAAAPEGEEEKACEVSEARLESLEKSIERLQSLGIQQGDEQNTAWHPILVNKDGQVETFPTLSAAAAAAAARSQATASSSSSATVGKDEPTTPAEKKAAKKGDKKGGKGGTPTAAAAAGAYPYGMMYPGYGYGYPGYPGYGYGGYNMAMAQHAAAVSRAAAAVQAAHLSASASAGKNAKKDLGSFYANVLDPLAAAVNPKEAGQPLTPENKEGLRKQVEFYFSTNNLCKDLYLRQHMGADGWTSLELIAQFPMVRKFKATLPELIEAVEESSFFEINKDTKCLRLQDEAERQKWQAAPVSAS